MNELKENTRKEKIKIVKDLVIIFAGGTILYFILKEKHYFEFTSNYYLLYFSCSLIAGWRSLKNLAPKRSLFGFVFFLYLKISISSLIGGIVLPFRVLNNVRKYYQLCI